MEEDDHSLATKCGQVNNRYVLVCQDNIRDRRADGEHFGSLPNPVAATGGVASVKVMEKDCQDPCKCTYVSW